MAADPISSRFCRVLPANVTPYDPNISAGVMLQPGDSVYLSGMPGLPAGVYQLLPSRYALLPNAYLVTEVSGYQDIQRGQSFSVLGGGTIVAGYRAVAGTSFGDSRTNGFDVVPASIVLQQAQYTTTGANQFFASQAAAQAANQTTSPGASPTPVSLPRLPQDSGVVALVASDALTVSGTLRTAPASGGLGAEVDISSTGILVASGAAATQPGQLLLTTASLNDLGAQTLLLGGLRSGDAIDTTAQIDRNRRRSQVERAPRYADGTGPNRRGQRRLDQRGRYGAGAAHLHLVG